MSSLVRVAIHASQFPENVRHDLLESLRTRRVNHKFHYDSIKQTQKWLALHQAFSPSRTDADCAATYDHSFAAVAARVDSPRVHLIGLGCGLANFVIPLRTAVSRAAHTHHHMSMNGDCRER